MSVMKGLQLCDYEMRECNVKLEATLLNALAIKDAASLLELGRLLQQYPGPYFLYKIRLESREISPFPHQILSIETCGSGDVKETVQNLRETRFSNTVSHLAKGDMGTETYFVRKMCPSRSETRENGGRSLADFC